MDTIHHSFAKKPSYQLTAMFLSIGSDNVVTHTWREERRISLKLYPKNNICLDPLLPRLC